MGQSIIFQEDVVANPPSFLGLTSFFLLCYFTLSLFR
jgi:hypothetical protein